MASDLLVATRSTHKLDEIRAILTSVPRVRLLSLADLEIQPTPAEDEIESHPTFLENAIAKARYFRELTDMPVLADDSGLMVDALAGGPGVRTRRFAIDEGYVPAAVAGSELDRANNRLLLEKLAHVNVEARAARYVCAAALVGKDGNVISAIGVCAGRIGREERGTAGFGYDPLFELPDLGVTFAELTPEQKNQRSHRALAFRALAPHIKLH